MSRIFYKIFSKKYLLLVWIGVIFPLICSSQDTMKTTTDYFNAGAEKYINNKSTEALKLVHKGLAIDSSDEKLKKLAELILKKDKDKQQQNQQNQNQNKDQNKDENKDENKDQQNKDKQDDKKDQEQQQNDQLTKDDAERMLDALNNKDKNLQDELKDEKVKAVNTQVEKDW